MSEPSTPAAGTSSATRRKRHYRPVDATKTLCGLTSTGPPHIDWPLCKTCERRSEGATIAIHRVDDDGFMYPIYTYTWTARFYRVIATVIDRGQQTSRGAGRSDQ